MALLPEARTFGKNILILERGDWLNREADNWDAAAVFEHNRYVSPDTWYDRNGRPFQPQVHYFVGGATKLFGAALYRLRQRDFAELRHYDGISPAGRSAMRNSSRIMPEPRRCITFMDSVGTIRPSRPQADPPCPPVSDEPRISQLRDRPNSGRLPSIPCSLCDHVERGQHGVQHLYPL